MKTSPYRLILALALVGFSPACFLSVASAATAASTDEAQIRKVAAEFVAAWNRHDTKAMAATFAADGDLINPWGRVAKGRAEIESLFRDEHSGGLKDTTFAILEQSVRTLAPNVALSEWSVEITGMKDPTGKMLPPAAHHVVVIFLKNEGKWLSAIARPYAFQPPPPRQK